MPDMLATASAFLDARLKASASQTGTYRRKGASVALTCPIGSTPIGMELGPGIIQTWQSRDLLPLVDDLKFGATLVPVFAGTQFYPEVGDIWEQVIRGETIKWEVQKADDGRCWRWCDHAAVTADADFGSNRSHALRIHTRQITTR